MPTHWVSHKRGHRIEFDRNKNYWVYSDNKKSIIHERPCSRCKRMPTKEGHDACLGTIPGIKSACCGHGVANKILMKNDE